MMSMHTVLPKRLLTSPSSLLTGNYFANCHQLWPQNMQCSNGTEINSSQNLCQSPLLPFTNRQYCNIDWWRKGWTLATLSLELKLEFKVGNGHILHKGRAFLNCGMFAAIHRDDKARGAVIGGASPLQRSPCNGIYQIQKVIKKLLSIQSWKPLKLYKHTATPIQM